MNKYKCIIVDDERGAHLVLKNYIGRIERLELTGTYFNAVQAINFLHQNEVDLLFLDIKMPEMTGLEMLQTIHAAPKVILTTAYTQFALESYEFGVFDYLVKPIPFPRFLKAINRFIAEKTTEKSMAPSKKKEVDFLFKVNGELVKIVFENILYIQSYGNFVKIYTTQKTYLVSSTTQEIEHTLPKEQFVRIQKSFIVSIDKITGISKNEVSIGSTKIPIGISYRKIVAQTLISK